MFRRGGGAMVVRYLSRDIGQPTYFTHPELLKENEVLPGMNKAEFAMRRTKLMELIGCSHTKMSHDKHVMIIPGASIKYMSADVPYCFHQNTNMLYLSGFMEPDSVLVMESHHNSLPQHKSVLYVKPRDPLRELWDGPRAGMDDAVEFTGVDESYTIDELSDHLETKYSTEGYCVWYSEDSTCHPKHAELIADSLTRSPHSNVKDVHSPSQYLAELRLIKSPSELSLMRRAGDLTGHAFRAAMEGSYSGVEEKSLESIFEHSIKTGGAQWLSFPPVVAGGNRANCLHYITNNRTIKEGELVLMDAGCEYHGYVSDVTRTWPVSGEFSPAQRELYEIVRTTKEEIIELCRPGVTLNYLHSITNEILATQLKKMGLLSYHMSKSKLTQAMNQLFPHHVGHYLGLDTHDTATVDRGFILSPGMVVTIEPGVYISDNFSLNSTSVTQELRGTGIRLEDDVLVTDGAAEVLNMGCPDDVQEIKKLIQNK